MLLSIALLLRESKIVLHNKRGEFSTRLGKPKEYLEVHAQHSRLRQFLIKFQAPLTKSTDG